MKALRASAVAMALAVFSPPSDAAWLKSFQNPARTVVVASHRACWKLASENSIDGIRACIARGIDMVEVDVRLPDQQHPA